jgi:hypothetical protein
MPMPRKSLVSVDTTPSYHVVSRCVRRTFLFGMVDNKDFSHRRDAIVERLSELANVVLYRYRRLQCAQSALVPAIQVGIDWALFPNANKSNIGSRGVSG